jgi:hypothetical protein
MTKKHFIALAQTIKTEAARAKTEAERAVVRRLAEGIASVCAEGNGRFDRGRFLHACGVLSV